MGLFKGSKGLTVTIKYLAHFPFLTGIDLEIKLPNQFVEVKRWDFQGELLLDLVHESNQSVSIISNKS